MPTVPLYLRARQYERLRELERILRVPWQEIVRTAIDEFIARNRIEEIKSKLEARLNAARKKAL
ncbi:MAG: hypothetical protein DRZ76_02955 [Candidatus Nealsonbacteria bacterium]|nr:MAG: hypothetical protein DRZ76_02955 [Candidatus Nealsonbacteria bacterium]